MARFINYPNLPTLSSISPEDQQALLAWWSAMISELNSGGPSAANRRPFYNVQHVSVNRDFDVSSATLAQVVVFLGTLASDLQRAGVIA